MDYSTVKAYALVALLLLSCGVRRQQAFLESPSQFTEPHQLHTADQAVDLKFFHDDQCVALPVHLTTTVQRASSNTTVLGLLTHLPEDTQRQRAGGFVSYGLYGPSDDPDALAQRCVHLSTLRPQARASEALSPCHTSAPADYHTRQEHETSYTMALRTERDSTKRQCLGEGLSSAEVTRWAASATSDDTVASSEKWLVIWSSAKFQYGDRLRLELAQSRAALPNEQAEDSTGGVVGYSRIEWRLVRGPGLLTGPAIGAVIIVFGTIALL